MLSAVKKANLHVGSVLYVSCCELLMNVVGRSSVQLFIHVAK